MRNRVLDTGKHLSPPSVLQLMGFDRRAHNLADWDLFLFRAPLAVLLTLWLCGKSLGGILIIWTTKETRSFNVEHGGKLAMVRVHP